MYADVPDSNLGGGNFFSFFFEKNLVFLALGFRVLGLGCRVRKHRSTIQQGVWGAQPSSLVQSVHISRDYHGNRTTAHEGAWDCVKVVTPVDR